MMAEIDIEVRSLDGQSTTLSIPRHLLVGDLKAILSRSFPSAPKSPDFHLFFKGAKLGINSRIDSFSVVSGDFLVLVPFVKKPGRSTIQSDPMKCSQESMMSAAANSSWQDVKNDLLSLSEVLQDQLPPNNPVSSENPKSGNNLAPENSMKRKRDSDRDRVLCDLLNRGDGDGILQLVGMVNCLSNDNTGRCFLYEECFRSSEAAAQCMCPAWLKRVLKIFTFVNVFYGFCQKQLKFMTLNCLEEAFKRSSGFGVEDFCTSDVENLSRLCPKMVVIIGKQEDKVTKLGSPIVVGRKESAEGAASTERTAFGDKPRAGRKHASMTAIVNAIQKRSHAFKTDLCKAMKCYMEEPSLDAERIHMLSLDDILAFLRDASAGSRGHERKLAKTRFLQSGCLSTTHLEPKEMIEHLRNGVGCHGQIVHIEEVDAKPAIYVELPDDLTTASKATLKAIGVTELYSHQAEAIKASLCGKNVVVATSTSSGKSLCYNLPVIEALSQSISSCAIYIFPTKALAQDQLRALLEMTRSLESGLNVGVYDGDTSQDQRVWIRDNARLLITNPDMLHMSIMPYHGQFQRILANLRFVVIDETHTYRGAFGCHAALILRRLRRICSHAYGSTPQFIFCTATSANPSEHAMSLANLEAVELVSNDGSPCGLKYFILWNPPMQLVSKTMSNRTERKAVKQVINRRSSPILEVSYLFAEMVQHGLRCITFCKTRKLSELVLSHTREILHETSSDLVDSICVYRAGYTPQERRRIETDLFNGKLRGVAATNALELGIDVGHIDATLHLGFPGTVASLWQQAGRSGRRARPSLAIYVAFDGPLDQYFMKFPRKLFQMPVEHVHVDAHNQKVLEQHIACAAVELPLCSSYDEKYFGSGLEYAITALKNKGWLGSDSTDISSTKMWSYIGAEESPSRAVSIRAIDTEKYKVLDSISNELFEEIEENRAFFQVYEGAVYLHQGSTYLVKTLDLSTKIAVCQKADLKYYTKTRDYTDIHVTGSKLAYPPVKASEMNYLQTSAQANSCTVTTKWFGFYRIWRISNQIFDSVELFLPTYSYESQAVWIRVPRPIKNAVENQELSFRAGLHAASHALLNVVPLYLMCNISDLRTDCANPHETRDFPERILLYDQHPGGIGISAQVQVLFGELLIAAMELVITCSCSSQVGCPNCIQAFSCSEYNEVLDKKASIMILKGIIEAEKSFFGDWEESSNFISD